MRLLCLLLLTATAAAAAAQTRSVYTTLDPARCTLVEANADEGWSAQRCPGTAGYALVVSESDLRQTVDVVAPGGATFPLDFGATVSGRFSAVGERAEWRVAARGRPVALVVRLVVQASEDPVRSTSMLAVARVSPRSACVVAVVQPAADMNAQARRLADRAARMPCLTAP